MKFKFDSRQQYQLDAISSVVDLFEGQPKDVGQFREILRGFLSFETDQQSLDIGVGQQELSLEIGAVGNHLFLGEDTILDNLQRVQEQNQLMVSDQLVDGLQFDVEMETGTGKTYVYLRTIFELAEKYDFKKFVILVPSVAIREGVNKSIELMRAHFRELYPTQPFSHFVYSGDNPGQVHGFATGTSIQIMIMTVAAIKGTKNNRIFHQSREELGGLAPVDYLRAVRPFVILDEPQNMESDLSEASIGKLNYSAILRYSATHRKRRNLVYQLDPVDAHNLELVKQIVVAEVVQEGVEATPYIKLLDVNPKNWTAKLELAVRDKNGNIVKKAVNVKKDRNLEQVTDNPAYSNNWFVTGMSIEPAAVELSHHPRLLVGEEIGGNTEAIYRDMIRETIREHLEKEESLRESGIKVLSLFFVDKVASYMGDGDSLASANGPFAQWFDEIYQSEVERQMMLNPDFGVSVAIDPDETRSAYFASTKKGVTKDSKDGNSDDDSRAYDLIMKDKERLLSLDEPVRFIFSHSALREGWDNPNVFQICTLREMGGETERRQTLGRGLRLPVDQQGNRYSDRSIAQLTVVANESYTRFAKGLQDEYIRAGVEIGFVRPQEFAKIIDPATGSAIGAAESQGIRQMLQSSGFIDAEGFITSRFTPDEDFFSLHLGDLERLEPMVIDAMRAVSVAAQVKPLRKRRKRKLNKEVYLDPQFAEMWDTISQRTTYSVAFDRNQLVSEAIDAIKQAPTIPPLRVNVTKATVTVNRGGTEGTRTDQRSTNIEDSFELPDIIAQLQESTSLTRRTIADILIGSGRLAEFTKNPNGFIAMANEAIQSVLARVVEDGLQYEKIGGSVYSLRELQADGVEEKQFFLDTLYELQNKQKSDFNYVVTDSQVEKDFAKLLDNDKDVRLFTKLPPKFKVPTPVGPYNPDWAIIKRVQGEDRLYLIRETKSTNLEHKLRETEKAKIRAARKHFAVLGVDYGVSAPDAWNIG
ncbi:DEAD/DEAH box helicase family protein [Corynebacterium sp. Q4381]|uniref:restriction endonuclease n=1 Tax=Corynebacterium sp. Marseille-Q4381 TaxID=3121597 RepID=UPI002FE57228